MTNFVTFLLQLYLSKLHQSHSQKKNKKNYNFTFPVQMISKFQKPKSYHTIQVICSIAKLITISDTHDKPPNNSLTKLHLIVLCDTIMIKVEEDLVSTQSQLSRTFCWYINHQICFIMNCLQLQHMIKVLSLEDT